MDIVLNTIFNNPLLPKMLRPGMEDNFGRTPGTELGETEDKKPWSYIPESMPWIMTDDGQASVGNNDSRAIVDAEVPDGTLVATIGKITGGTSGRARAGVIVRYIDENNYLALETTGDGAALPIRKVNGSRTTMGSSVWVAEGMKFTVICNGPTVEFIANTTSLGVITAPELENATKVGLLSETASAGRYAAWANIKFTPAA